MRIRVEYITEGEDEVVIKCKEVTDQVRRVVSLLKGARKISGEKDGKLYLISPIEIYYCESVDNVVFIYTNKNIFRTSLTLKEIEEEYEEMGLFRCSKGMIININAIVSLKSEVGNKIDAILKSGEHVIISRRYAKELRRILKSKSGDVE